MVWDCDILAEGTGGVMRIIGRRRDAVGVFSGWWSGTGDSVGTREIILKLAIIESIVCCFVHKGWGMAEILEHVSCNAGFLTRCRNCTNNISIQGNGTVKFP